MTEPRLAVLVSGSGTLLEAFLAAGVVPDVVLSDRPCRGLTIAESAGVEAVLVDRRSFGGFTPAFDRDAYASALTDALIERAIDLVAMAGFGTVLAPAFFARYTGCVLNTHPSLLPAFKGWHAVRDALVAGAAETGCTVHVATEALDDGPVLAQVTVPVLSGDDEATLHERIKEVERTVYPEVVGRVMAAWRKGRRPASLAIGED